MVAALYSRVLFCLVLTALAGVVKNQDQPATTPSPTVNDANNKNTTVADTVNKNITVADAVNKNMTVNVTSNKNVTVDVTSNMTVEVVKNETIEETLVIVKNLSCDGYECCPSPYTNAKDECFYVSQDKMPWHEARYFCTDMKAELAEPKDLIALKDLIFKTSGGLKVFVGGWDATENGHFKWLNDTPIQDSDWANGEPNHEWNKEFCLGFHAGRQPMLFDMNCDNSLQFVCQYHFPE